MGHIGGGWVMKGWGGLVHEGVGVGHEGLGWAVKIFTE